MAATGSAPDAAGIPVGPASGEIMRVVKMPCAQCSIAITVSRKDKRVDKGSMYKHMLNSCPGVSRDYHPLLAHFKQTKKKSVLYASDIKSADTKSVQEAGYGRLYAGLIKLLEDANEMIEDKVKLNQGVSLLTSLSSAHSAPPKHAVSKPSGKQSKQGVHALRLLQNATAVGRNDLGARWKPKDDDLDDRKTGGAGGGGGGAASGSRRSWNSWGGLHPSPPHHSNGSVHGLKDPRGGAPPVPEAPSMRHAMAPLNSTHNAGYMRARAPRGVKRDRVEWSASNKGKQQAGGGNIKRRMSDSPVYDMSDAEPTITRGDWEVLYPRNPERVVPLERFYDNGSQVCIRIVFNGKARDRLLLKWFHECSQNPFVKPHIPTDVYKSESFAEIRDRLCGDEADPRLREWLTGQLKQHRTLSAYVRLGNRRFPTDLRFDGEGHVVTVPVGENKAFVAMVQSFFDRARANMGILRCSGVECQFYIESSAFSPANEVAFVIRAGSAIPDIGAGGGWGNDLVPGKYLFHMDLGDANAVQALVSKKTPAGSPRTAANGLSHADVVVKSEAKLQRASQNQFGTGSAVSSTVPAVAMMLAVANASPSRAVNIAKLPTASAVPADATGDSSKASIRRHSNGGGAGPQLNKGGAGEGMK